MPLNKYLQRHSELETGYFEDFAGIYRHVVVIPCHNEPLEAIRNLLQPPQTDGSVLIILVINQPESKIDCKADQLLWNTLNTQLNHLWENSNGSTLYALPDIDDGNEKGNGLLVVDRFSEDRKIPDKQGVGLARKIGADIACRLIHDGKITSNWIHSTDADVRMPDSYFQAPNADSDCSALIYPFQHHCPEATVQPLINFYDFKLRYYVAALQWCESGYGFHTIGSLICINATHYCQVRGFPKRSAAEDFYLLNKLAKVGQVQTLQAPTIEIEARLSDRVPFGTGPALIGLQQIAEPLTNYHLYHPNSFADLQRWLSLAGPLWRAQGAYEQHGLHITLRKAVQTLVIEKPDEQADRLFEVLGQLDLDRFLAHGFKQCSTEAAFTKQMFDWFDGFKTLRFIHLMRDSYFADISFQQLGNDYPDWLASIGLTNEFSKFVSA